MAMEAGFVASQWSVRTKATNKLDDGREALVTARVETKTGPLAALLEAVIASKSSASIDTP